MLDMHCQDKGKEGKKRSGQVAVECCAVGEGKCAQSKKQGQEKAARSIEIKEMVADVKQQKTEKRSTKHNDAQGAEVGAEVNLLFSV